MSMSPLVASMHVWLSVRLHMWPQTDGKDSVRHHDLSLAQVISITSALQHPRVATIHVLDLEALVADHEMTMKQMSISDCCQ